MAELPRNGDDVIDLVRKSDLAADDVLTNFLRQSGPLPPTADDTATRLIQAGILTPFQAKLILQGKYRGFLLGPYRILDQIGAGGMGQVYLAEHTRMQRQVALKVLPAKQAADKVGIERFYREARAVAALDHPNIVRAHDVACARNTHFLVMEYIEGRSLAELQEEAGGKLPVGEACGYAVQAAAGLAHAHEKGLAHRDIKPGNLLVDANGVLKILDMGLARFFEDENDRLTRNLDPGGVMGTADYVAPEQLIDSSGADHRADIYSLGATLYHLVTGRTPFEGTVTAKLIAHQLKTVPKAHTLNQGVPAEVSAIIAKMMAKDPDARYQSAAEVVAALLPHVTQGRATGGKRNTGNLPPIAAAAVNQTTANLRDSLEQAGRAEENRRKKRIAIAALVAVAMIGTGLIAALAMSDGDKPDNPAPANNGGDDLAERPQPQPQPGGPDPGTPVQPKPKQPVPDVFSVAYRPDVGKASVEAAVFTPDDKWLVTCGNDKLVQVWDGATGKIVRKLEGHTQSVRAMSLLQDGKRLLSASHDRTLKLWDITTGECLRTYEGHTASVVNVAALPDCRRFLSSANDGSIFLWDLATAEILKRYDPAPLPVYGLAVTRDGKRAVASTWDSKRNTPKADLAKLTPVAAWVFEIESGKELKRLPNDTSMSHLTVSHDGRYAVVGTNTGVIVWDLDSPSLGFRVFTGVTKRVTCGAFTRDNRHILGTGYDNNVAVWDVASGKIVRAQDGLTAQGYYVSTSHDGKRAAVTGANGVCIVWNLPNSVAARVPPAAMPKPRAVLTGLTGPPEDILFTPDGRRVIGASNPGRHVRIWDAASGEDVGRLTVPPGGVGGVRGLALLPNDRLATCVATDPYIRIWNLRTSEQVGQVTCNTPGFVSLAAMPDGRLLAASADRTVRVCDPDAGREDRRFAIGAEARGLAVVPGGKRFVVGCGDRSVRLWDMTTNTEVRKLSLKSVPWRITISPDGQWAAFGNDKLLQFWHLETGDVRALEGADKFLDGVAFTRDGRFVLSGGTDRAVFAWEVATGRLIGRVADHTNSIRGVALSPDGTRLATSSIDGTGLVWQMPDAMVK
jgi:serine/threonine-protein kinase